MARTTADQRFSDALSSFSVLSSDDPLEILHEMNNVAHCVTVF